MAKKKQVSEAKMDMTPMIDVTFQLLIFFLVATKFKELEKKLDSFLPKDSGSGPSDSPPMESLLIEIRGNGEPDAFNPAISVLGTPVVGFSRGNTSEYWGRLQSMIEQRKGNFEKTEIDAANYVPWEFVALTLNACIKANCLKITFSAKPTGAGM